MATPSPNSYPTATLHGTILSINVLVSKLLNEDGRSPSHANHVGKPQLELLQRLQRHSRRTSSGALIRRDKSRPACDLNFVDEFAISCSWGRGVMCLRFDDIGSITESYRYRETGLPVRSSNSLQPNVHVVFIHCITAYQGCKGFCYVASFEVQSHGGFEKFFLVTTYRTDLES